MTPEQLEVYLTTLSPRDMMANLDLIAGMARRIRLKQGVGSQEDELTLCRVMLDLKFMTELVDALKSDIHGIASLRATYERMLEDKNKELEALKLTNGRDVQSAKTGTRHKG